MPPRAPLPTGLIALNLGQGYRIINEAMVDTIPTAGGVIIVQRISSRLVGSSLAPGCELVRVKESTLMFTATSMREGGKQNS